MVGFKLNVLYLVAGFFGIACDAYSVTFHLVRRTDPKESILQSSNLPANFDRSKPTYVILHGLGGSHIDGCTRSVQSALLKRGDVNVIAVDYAISAFGYTAAYNSIASQVSSFLLRNGINPANTMVIGQSMGAQVAGVLYRYGFKPNSIIGTDPAGPQFNTIPSSYKLSPASANTVQAVHTNTGGLGSTSLDGTLDVYINRGTDFPCCSTSVCRHIGACDWIASTIRNGPTSSVTCSSQTEALTGTCQGSIVLSGFDAPPSWYSARTIAHVSLNQCVSRGV